jgi:hypothetical protein
MKNPNSAAVAGNKAWDKYEIWDMPKWNNIKKSLQ